jgi:hypothetical protein
VGEGLRVGLALTLAAGLEVALGEAELVDSRAGSKLGEGTTDEVGLGEGV